MTPRELATIIARLNARDLVELNRLLRDLPGWSGAGVREPRRPRGPVDATGIALDAEVGKSDTTRTELFGVWPNQTLDVA